MDDTNSIGSFGKAKYRSSENQLIPGTPILRHGYSNVTDGDHNMFSPIGCPRFRADLGRYVLPFA